MGNNNLLEKAVLNKIDELIKILIELSAAKGTERENLRNKGVEKSKEIIPLLLHFLEGNTQYIEPMIYQLVREKLPDPTVIASFGHLQEELKVILHNGIKDFLENTPKIKEEKIIADREVVPCTEKQREANDLLEDDNNIPNTFPEKSTPSLYNTALIAFPNEEILENYRVRSQILEVFFPNMKLGLVKENNSMAQSRIKYFCNLLGIQLIFVPNAIVNNPKKLYRYVMIKAKK